MTTILWIAVIIAVFGLVGYIYGQGIKDASYKGTNTNAPAEGAAIGANIGCGAIIMIAVVGGLITLFVKACS